MLAPWSIQSADDLLFGLGHLDELLRWKISSAWSAGHRVTCPGAVVGVAVPLVARSRSTGLCLARLAARRLGLCGWYRAFCLELGAP